MAVSLYATARNLSVLATTAHEMAKESERAGEWDRARRLERLAAEIFDEYQRVLIADKEGTHE